jgi:hypothetical protein
MGLLRDALNNVTARFIVTPFPCYRQVILDEEYERVDPAHYEDALDQALVRINFNLIHRRVYDKSIQRPFNSCVARIVDVVICKPRDPPLLLTKRKLNDGPSREHPGSTTRRGKQIKKTQ